MYLGTEQAQGGKKKGQQQVLFVRGISHSEATQTAEGACVALFVKACWLPYRGPNRRTTGRRVFGCVVF